MTAGELIKALQGVSPNARILALDYADDGEFTIRLVTYFERTNAVMLYADPNEDGPGEKVLYRDLTEDDSQYGVGA